MIARRLILGLFGTYLAASVACGDDGSATGSGGAGTTGATSTDDATSSSTVGVGGGSNVTVAQCTEACLESQQGMCAGIIGECMSCCTAGLALAPAGGCSDEVDAYYDCVSEPPNVCDADCERTLQAFQDCMTNYCLAHLTDPNCQVLIGCVDLSMGEGGMGGMGVGGAGGGGGN